MKIYCWKFKPKNCLPRALINLGRGPGNRKWEKHLQKARSLPLALSRYYATPRRLAVRVQRRRRRQPAQTVRGAGPGLCAPPSTPTRKPTRACLAFAASCGVELRAFEAVKPTRRQWVRLVIGNQPGAETDGVPLAGHGAGRPRRRLPIPKRMRWGAGEHGSFVRPVHSAVLLFGDRCRRPHFSDRVGDTTHGRSPAIVFTIRRLHMRSARTRTSARCANHGSVLADFRRCAALHSRSGGRIVRRASLDGRAIIGDELLE